MKAVIYNPKGKFIQGMLDFDYACGREPSIIACVGPKKGIFRAFYGAREILIPIYDSLADVSEADVLINLASQRSAAEITKRALELDNLKRIVIVAEGVREQEVKELITNKKDKIIIGPATVGFVRGGEFKGGLAGGDITNIVKSKLYLKGSVGLVSKSGGMLNELMRIISRSSDGICEAVAVGGEVFPCSTMLDHILRFENDPEIKLIVALGEIGAGDEYEIIKAKREGKITKPLIMYVTGSSASLFPWEVQFGHAAAKASKKEETAQAKNAALKEAGVIVPDNFDAFESTIKQVSESLGLYPKTEAPKQLPPMDYTQALRKGLIRKPASIVTSISHDPGEIHYNNVPVNTLFNDGSIGRVIGHLWFKKDLPDYFAELLEKAIILAADHGAAVSAAHNAIVTSRAGKDIISSLCSGLLTIGPRFGGAVDDAMRNFWNNADHDAYEFVESMKKQGKRIPGIGHRVKSRSNPDKRVELLKEFAKKIPENKHLLFALKVEEITLKKSEKLILNVDGALAAILLDAMVSSGFTDDEINSLLEIGFGNALFALSRSIGIIGHAIDQKRLNQPLYRHATDDILFVEP